MQMKQRFRSRGLSLIMVTAVVAVASVMGMAILSSSALQAEAANNQDQVAQADALAESGVNVAMYYLQNLNDNTKCPAAIASLGIGVGNYTVSNVSLGASVNGTYTIVITRPSANRYQIVSTGKATATTPGVNRSLTVVADVNYFAYGMSAANVSSSGSWTIPASYSITGDLYTTGSVVNNGTVSGAVYSVAASGSGSTGLIKSLLNVVVATLTPTTASVNHYLTYTYNGSTYTSGLLLLPQSNVTLGPTGSNPAGVYYATALLDITGNVKINGTLVCSTGATLRVSGTGNSITPAAGFPALVVDGDVKFNANNAVLDLNGLVFLGGNINRSGAQTGCKLNITGSLLLGTTGTPALDSAVAVAVKYDRTKSAVTTLTSGATKPAPSSISIVSWKN